MPCNISQSARALGWRGTPYVHHVLQSRSVASAMGERVRGHGRGWSAAGSAPVMAGAPRGEEQCTSPQETDQPLLAPCSGRTVQEGSGIPPPFGCRNSSQLHEAINQVFLLSISQNEHFLSQTLILTGLNS